ncbi:MAG: DNA translocase FtsK 4TM domain-containing protein, partial [Sediminibacterium sp.]
MANSLKKKTPPPPSPEKLTADKEAEVTVTEVVKDERTTKIVGAFSLLLTAFLFVSLTSYLFTWQEDQDKVHQFGIKIFATDDVKVTNLLGVLGAYVAHGLIYKGFGLASFLFCTTFFVLGVNLLFGKKIFSLLRNLKYVLVGLLVISMTLSFAARGNDFSWGGAVGELLTEWSIKWIGNVGTGAVLFLAMFSYFIWRFNPVFKVPEWKFNNAKKADTSILPLTEDDEQPVFKQWNEGEEEIPGADDEIEPGEPVSNNKMKNEGKGVVVIMPHPENSGPANPMTHFDMVEKEEEGEEDKIPEPIIENIIAPAPSVSIPSARDQSPDLELEIKESPEEEEEEDELPAKPVGKIGTKYDVTLDLKDYKYPSLDLLEIHGSEKIVHDPQELETNKNQIIATLKNYDIAIQRIAATVGPTVTLYEIVPAPGVRISRIKNLEDDIALS